MKAKVIENLIMMKQVTLTLLVLTLFFTGFLCKNSSTSKSIDNSFQSKEQAMPATGVLPEITNSERIVYIYDKSNSYVTEIHFYHKNDIIKKVNIHNLNPYNELQLMEDGVTESMHTNYIIDSDKNNYKSVFPKDYPCVPTSVNSSSVVYEKGSKFTCIAFRCYLYSDEYVIDQKSTLYVFNSLGEVVTIFRDLATHASLPFINTDGTYLVFSYTDFKDCKAMPKDKGYYIYSTKTNEKVIWDNTEGISYAYLIDGNMVMATKKDRQKKIKEYKFYDLKNRVFYHGALSKDIYSNIIRFEIDKIIVKENKINKEKKYTDYFKAGNF